MPIDPQKRGSMGRFNLIVFSCYEGKKMKSKRGFTLVELLVVISIIAILLAILMPSISKARKTAQRVVCMSNLKQWGIITFTYTAENDGRFLMGWNKVMQDPPLSVGDPDLMDAIWMLPLEPYYQEPAIRLCPSAKKLTGVEGSTRMGWGPLTLFGETKDGFHPYGSYAINGWIRSLPKRIAPGRIANGARGMGLDAFWKSVDKLKRPEKIPLFMDGGWPEARPKALDTIPKNEGAGGTSGATHWDEVHVGMWRHSYGINLALGDGSVTTVKPLNKLWNLKWSTNFDTIAYTKIRWSDYQWLTRQ